MSDLADPPQHRILQLYATGEHACSYLPQRQARSQVVLPAEAVTPAVYARLLEQGFRRSGQSITYRPWCDGCQACVPLRIAVAGFAPNRSQRRAWKQHGALTARVLPLEFVPEHYTLYQAYQQARHSGGNMASDSPQDYRDFILGSAVESVLVEFRHHGVLKMVALVDVLPAALSAVYTFYADDARCAYGTYAVLWQIELARQTGRDHLYLGYWIDGSATMHYKAHFKPCEVLQHGRWQDLRSTAKIS